MSSEVPWPHQSERHRTDWGMEGVSSSTDDQENITEVISNLSWAESSCSLKMTVRKRGKYF